MCDMGDDRDFSPTSTFELLQQMVAGDRSAGAQLGERINAMLQQAARRHDLRDELPNHIDLDDVVNEVWRSVLGENGLKAFRDDSEGALRKFMLAALDRRMIDAARRAQRQPDDIALDALADSAGGLLAQSQAPTPTCEARAADLWQLLESALGERDVRLLRGALEGRSASEMAPQLGISVEASQRALSRAKERAQSLVSDI